MNVASRDAFDRRIQRHVELASAGLADTRQKIMAEFAARGLLRSGACLKRQAEVRNERVADIVEWCLSEVSGLSGNVAAQWSEHGHAIRGLLGAFMTESRVPVLSDAALFGTGVERAIGEILDKGDAGALAELDEFGSGVWLPRSPRQVASVTNNTVNVGEQATVGNIQQAGDHSHLQSSNTQDIGSILRALDVFARAVGDAAISDGTRSAILAEIETIQPQLRKAAPSAIIVRESLQTLRNVVEGLAAGALTAPFLALLHAAAPLVGAG